MSLKEKEKIDLENVAGSLYYPSKLTSRKKLIFILLIEAALCTCIYYHYDNLAKYHALLAPTLLGMSSAALAQSLNQYVKRKLSFNRIAKFMLWGSINGCFTVMWVDLLMTNIEHIAYRVIVDQLVGAPIFQLVFSILNALWDHGEISSNFQSTYFNSLKYSYCFWPFFLVGLFVFLPQAVMFPANCVANLFWNIILSKLA